MDVTIKREALAAELALLEKVAPRRAAIPVVACALFEANKEAGTVTLAATDLRVGIRTVVKGEDVNVARSGRVLLPVGKASELVRTLDEHVRLQAGEGGSVTISSAGYRGTLQAQNVEDFPALPERAPDGLPHAISGVILSGFVKRTRFAVSDHEDTRGAITGALLEVTPDLVRMIATDGHRLSRAQLAAAKGQPTACVLSQRFLDAMGAIVADAEAQVAAEFEVGDRHAFVSMGDRVAFGQLIEGQFPAWQRLVPRPESHPHGCEVKRQPLIDALRRARMVGEGSRVILGFTKTGISVTAKSAEVGSGDEVVAAPFVGPDVEVAFNAGYLLDFLEAVECPEVRVMIKDAGSAAGVVATEGNVETCYAIMPLRI